VAEFLKVDASRVIKTLVYMADGKALAVLVRGDRSVNEIKLRKLLGAQELFLAREGQAKAAGVPPGFAGPVGLSIPIYADSELEGASGCVAGANEPNKHVTGLDLSRDAKDVTYTQLRLAEEGEPCARCGEGKYRSFRGIEVGHVFFLGTKYSVAMGANFLDEHGKEHPMVMGCYGIGITRIAAAAIEQHHDESGIRWPMQLAPYEVTLLALGNEPEIKSAAEKLYKELQAQGVDVLFDDRDERPGAKFKDAELIGIPLRLAIGKRSLKDGMAEVVWRDGREASPVPLAGAAKNIADLVASAKEVA